MMTFVNRKLINSALMNEQGPAIVVFNFHNICMEPYPLAANSTNVDTFKSQLNWITRNFQILPLGNAIEQCRSKQLTKPTACVTFDDGYATHLSIVAPMLALREVPATFFISSSHLSKQMLWNDWVLLFFEESTADQRKELEMALRNSPVEIPLGYSEINRAIAILKYMPLDRRMEVVDFIKHSLKSERYGNYMLKERDISTLSNMGFEIGGHTKDHPILAQETEADAQTQIQDDIHTLSSLANRSVTTFAFPNGKPHRDYTDFHVRCLERNNIQYAVTTSPGPFRPGHDPLQIPRVNLVGTASKNHLRVTLSASCSRGKIVSSRGYESS